jgi:hypothetical protein
VALLRIPFGDLVLVAGAEIPGLQPPQPLRLVFRFGPVRDTTPEDRVAAAPPVYKYPPGKVEARMDLQADKKVNLSVQAEDEIGNPAAFDGTYAYTVDDPSVIALTDNGDGTAVAAATGTLGVATVTATATRNSDGSLAGQGVLAFQVIAGDVASFEVVAGAPEEVTPDV